jgi:putative protease
MSLIEYVQDFIDMGITSLKIEGRMKRPEYSACAVSTLRTALDGYTPDMQTLQSVFSRSGFTDGYYTNTRRDMFGVRSKEDVVSAEDVLPKIRESYRKTRKVSKLKFSLTLEDGMPSMLTAIHEMCSYSVYGEVPQKAINRPLDKAIAEKQLSKLGGTIYEFDGLEFYSNGELTLSASALNELRRDIVSRIDSDRIHINEPIVTANNHFRLELPKGIGTVENPKVWVRLRNFNQLQGVDLNYVDRIILPLDEIVSHKDISKDLIQRLVVQPPRFIVNELQMIEKLSMAMYMGIKDIMCNNLAYIKIGNRLGLRLHGDFGLNVINSLSVESLQKLGCSDSIASFEMTIPQVNSLKKTMPIGLEVYGKLPLMLVRNCPIKNEVGCKSCKHSLSDRTNRSFPVYCSNGYAEVFNAETMSIIDRLDELKNVDYYVLSFLDETPDKVSAVLQALKDKSKVGTTKGLYIRGIV